MTNLESLIQLIDDGLIKIIFAREKLSRMRGQEDVFSASTSASTSTSTKPVLQHLKCGTHVLHQGRPGKIIMTGYSRQSGDTYTIEFEDRSKETVDANDPDLTEEDV
jgi:hypothetical protein